MGIFSFISAAGNQQGSAADGAPDAAVIKRELDALGLGTDVVTVSVAGDRIALDGSVANQAAFEKTVVAVGNTLGIAGVDASGRTLSGTAAETPVFYPVFYNVEVGDGLWTIAEAAYGKGQREKFAVILEANRPMLTDPEGIYPGRLLRIPDASTL